VSDLESQLWVNTLFRGRQLAEFLAVKKHLGIQSNTDVIRHLIHKQARALYRRRRPSTSPTAQPELPAAPAPLTGEGQAPEQSTDGPSLCFSCTLPDCDETDLRCLYRQAAGRRAGRG
jgi:hypothetical protein